MHNQWSHSGTTVAWCSWYCSPQSRLCNCPGCIDALRDGLHVPTTARMPPLLPATRLSSVNTQVAEDATRTRHTAPPHNARSSRSMDPTYVMDRTTQHNPTDPRHQPTRRSMCQRSKDSLTCAIQYSPTHKHRLQTNNRTSHNVHNIQVDRKSS